MTRRPPRYTRPHTPFPHPTLFRAWGGRQPGGIVCAGAANDAGAKSHEADLARIAGPRVSRSKHKCRVFWTQPGAGGGDATLATQWRTLDAPRPIADGRFTSRPGVFAWDRIDAASALLAEHLPAENGRPSCRESVCQYV